MRMDKNFEIKRGLVFWIFIILALGILFTPASCASSPFRTAPTSCAATSYCRLGTCINSQEGTCLENTPQKVCQDNSGVWVEGKPEDISQCQLGCCILGDQAAFVTQTRCKSLSGLYGLETNFRADIQSEEVCIASANPREKGACVLDDGLKNRNCRLLTRADCQQVETTSEGNMTIEFHAGLLCSAESLATNCGIPSKPKTTCIEDKDEVYFLDTCGNLANIYDASKKDDTEYWTTIKTKAESCSPDSGNVNSASCGNCDYLSGSTCKEYKRGNIQTPVQPNNGNFVCADLNCKYKGTTYRHGETWCATDSGSINKSLPGSESYRLACYNGEVTVEQCDSFRQTICIQDAIETDEGDFKTAQCRANLWRDCVLQENKEDCENTDKRDCTWLEGQSILNDEEGKMLTLDEEGNLVQGGGGKSASCIPKYAPGFDFWNNESEAETLCAVASQNCIVKFEKALLGDWKCKENCECIGLKEGVKSAKGTTAALAQVSGWIDNRNKMCIALGDCGKKTNYAGKIGYQSKDAVDIDKRI
ncbi:MAG: hypothetical protein NTW17_03120 [Candidatus Pacearchaeota archaeon]|nr:hypothetical protein [Candidatus Pacearchaeota archaeon]